MRNYIVVLIMLFSNFSWAADFVIEVQPKIDSTGVQELKTELKPTCSASQKMRYDGASYVCEDISSSYILNFASEVLSSMVSTLSNYLLKNDIPNCTSGQLLTKIDNTYSCTTPAAPAVSAAPSLWVMTSTSATRLGGTNYNVAQGNSASFDTASGWDSVNGKYVIPSTGKYQITFVHNMSKDPFPTGAFSNTDYCRVYISTTSSSSGFIIGAGATGSGGAGQVLSPQLNAVRHFTAGTNLYPLAFCSQNWTTITFGVSNINNYLNIIKVSE